ncbi:MAG: magnesium transporter CorA family protein [Acidimicrobiales bacterium]
MSPDSRQGAGQQPAPAPTAGTLVDAAGEVISDVGRADIEARLASGQFFWLDLPRLGDEEVGWMGDVFHFHPLAIEDAVHFRQRPKLEDYDGYSVLVLYGSAMRGNGQDELDGTDSGSLTPDRLESVSEVHCFMSEAYLVTVHREDCPAFADLARRLRDRKQAHSAAHLFYRVADTLVDSFFPVLSDLDDRIDLLQTQVVSRPTDQQLSEVLAYKGALITLRRVIAPQRDVFAGLSGEVSDLPGIDDDSRRYLRDVYDHLIRLADLLDSYRDLLSGTMDAYLSVVSNRLNDVMKQLTIIATVFLPLSFLTGFFGQNFGWMVNRLGSFAVFVGAGIGSEVLAAVVLMLLFYRRGWLASRG